MKTYPFLCCVAAAALAAAPAAEARLSEAGEADMTLPKVVLMAPIVEVSVHTYQLHGRRYRVERRAYYHDGRRVVVYRRYYY